MTTLDDTIAALIAQKNQPQPMGAGSADSGMGPMMSVPPQHLQQMAGDVIPLPITPGPNAGPPASGAPVMDVYRAGKPPNVQFMPADAYRNHIMNILKR
jgi:hypothetical protein